MEPAQQDITGRMRELIDRWKESADGKALFLDCYCRMTNNMLEAIELGEFHDPAWVRTLLLHFADYYFNSLEAWEGDPASAPVVWQRAHGIATSRDVTALQKMLLGINAHINYDLVFTLDDLLHRDWRAMSPMEQSARKQDYLMVNGIIERTIDSVQDEVLEPSMPVMDLFDKLLGRVDEYLLSRLINKWRERVWENAEELFEADDRCRQDEIRNRVEKDALRVAGIICRGEGPQVKGKR